MLAGDIMIGKDVLIGTGDIVVVLVLALLVGGGLLIWWSDRRANRRTANLIQAARDLEISEGITLYEGIRACFGEDGLWVAPEDSVYVFAAALGGSSASLRVCPEMGQIEVYDFSRKRAETCESEPEALIGCLIEVVNKQVTFRRT